MRNKPIKKLDSLSYNYYGRNGKLTGEDAVVFINKINELVDRVNEKDDNLEPIVMDFFEDHGWSIDAAKALLHKMQR